MEKESLGSRIKKAFNVFGNKNEDNYTDFTMAGIASTGSNYRPDRNKSSRGTERSIVNALYNRIAMDVATVNIKHVKLDDKGRYLEDVDSKLSNCLTIEANKDQTARAFRQDIVESLCDEGVVAVCPIDTYGNPFSSHSYDIETMRVGKIVTWYPDHVKVNIYDDRAGVKKDIIFPKSSVAIIENPLYSIMNEPNSVLKRLIRKLNLLDVVDEQSGSGKLDLIIQLPYALKGDLKKKQAEERRKDIENQLAGSKYGIAYIDGTEHVTQINRATENNLMKQVEYLTTMLYSQLGISSSILEGTADEQTMLNYNNRTIEPILSAITDEMRRKFLTKTARTQRQDIMYFRDPFKLVPVNNIAEMADKFTRNEIMTSNEIRQTIGMKPADDPNADVLRNKNLNQSNASLAIEGGNEQEVPNDIEGGNEQEVPNDIEEVNAPNLKINGDTPISNL